MRYLSIFLSLALVLVLACETENKTTSNTTASEAGTFSVQADLNPALDYEHLRLYPVVADANFIEKNQAAAQIQTMATAMEQPRFRIVEKQPFGRFDDNGAVNELTVSNKTEQPVYLMAGDVVKGGRQDRVIAEDQLIAARSLRNIPVFCVEAKRWYFRDDSGSRIDDHSEKAKDKRIYAFSGYYHVASSDLRRTVVKEADQQAVWDKVSEITIANDATTSTKTYTGLEGSTDFTAKRDGYLAHFKDKFADQPEVIGVIAVSGDKVISTDIFGRPELFQQQYQSLLHSYISEAITNGDKPGMSEEEIAAYGKKLQVKYDNPGADKFMYQGALVRFSDL